MPSELIFLLILVGAGTGTISTIMKVSPALIAIPAFYFFLPVFNLSFSDVVLPVVSTCLIAFLPAHLYSWIQSMKNGEVDFERLISFAPGIVMGGIIGAQLLSLMSFSLFKVTFSLIALISILNIILALKLISVPVISLKKWSFLPIGLLIGSISLLSGSSGRVLGESLLMTSNTELKKREGTINGLVVFASIAAMVGFIYPAQAFNYSTLLRLDSLTFAGSMHLPSLIVLALSHGFFCFLCCNRANNTLDNTVLSVSYIVFIFCTLVRLWVSY
jgi:uncharacterized membrane protein YfcA